LHLEDGLQTIQTKELEAVLSTLAAIYKDKDHAAKFLRIAEIIQKDIASAGIASSKGKNLKIFVDGEEVTLDDKKSIFIVRKLYEKKCFYPKHGLSFSDLVVGEETEAADIHNYLKRGKNKEKEFKDTKKTLSKIICKGFNDEKFYLSRGVVISVVP
jgi:hypothetical protein